MMAHPLQRWLGAVLLVLACLGAARAEQPSNLRGDPDAPVTILVFSAFACPYCAETRNTLEQVLAAYPGKVNLLFKHYPLGADSAAWLPHEAAAAAGEQGKFWEMHDALFGRQGQLGERGQIDSLARELGLDAARFDAALASRAGTARIRGDVAEANALKVQATPTFYIGGYKFEGAQSVSVLKTVIDHLLVPGPASRAQSLQDKLRDTQQRLTPAIERMQQARQH
ncbi:DsbA family protein [Pseudoduganella violacea]|uniref:Protein-disulfide isomerase n=1 Tax=Pseudoduganella violacea TaxID=1715466 RepID=A0A7W5FX30_9BURK|nr:thioredoxin domain-containing protein [Pseudoduganella violacea]MBB3122422.1 protein-disulfide isomerase [Pseudoduganella violacea]